MFSNDNHAPWILVVPPQQLDTLRQWALTTVEPDKGTVGYQGLKTAGNDRDSPEDRGNEH